MGCLVGCLALAFPRVALALVWLFGGDYVTSAFPQWGWAVAGFFFLPTTTLAFAYATHSHGDATLLSPFGWLIVALAAAIDLGLMGGGGAGARKWKRDRDDDDD